MDLENILDMLSHTHTDYSGMYFDNVMDNQHLQELPTDSFECLQEIDCNTDDVKDEDLIDLDDFQDIFGDLNEDGTFDTHPSPLNDIKGPKASLPCFQEAFKMFISNTSTQERLRNHNVKYGVNSDNSKNIHEQKQNDLQNTSIHNITDESYYDLDDITLVIDNDKATDEIAGKLKENTMEYDSDCPGYRSSDFEFISESEAGMDGLIINYSNKKLKSRNKKNRVRDSGNNKLAQKYNLLHEDYHSRCNETHRDEEDRENDHIIPEGDDFFNLFLGHNEPIVPMYYMLENKSLGANSCMAIEYEGMGFDMRMIEADDIDDDELKEDAKRSAKKILEMYPFENCERKRRH